MEELSEEGTETARLHSGQNKDIQDETSERNSITKLMHTCILCVHVFFVDLLYNEGVNKATTCKSYGPLTQKLMAVCVSFPYLLLPLILLFQTFIDKVESLSSTVISPAALEKRLKEELVTLGLLDPPEVRY